MNLFTYCFFLATYGITQCYQTNNALNNNLIEEFNGWAVKHDKIKNWLPNHNLTKTLQTYYQNKKYIETIKNQNL